MEDLSKKVVFITGINGFTGIHLENFFLNKGWIVYGTTYAETENENHFVCDITNKSQIKSVFNKIQHLNFIIHTAAISFVAGDNQNDMYNVNVFGTLNLLDVIIESGLNPDKVLIASSAAVYGNIGETLSEDMCPKPVNHYGNSKLVMENMTKAYFPKLNIIITRPFNYTGVGQSDDFLVPKITSHFKSKSPSIELGNIDVFREFNDVDYLTNCYYNLLVSDYISEIVNVCSGKTNNIKEILLGLEKISKHKMNVEINPKFIRHNEIRTLRGSVEKLNGMICLPSDNNLMEVLKKMYFNNN
jgi:nucleoside-diphosphate-sugar epimerase